MLLFFSRKADSAFLRGGASMVAMLVDVPATLGFVGRACKRGAELVDALPVSGSVVTAMVFRCDGGTVLLFVLQERFDWGGLIPLDCPGLIGLLDTAALARRPIKLFRVGKVRFLSRERLDLRF